MIRNLVLIACAPLALMGCGKEATQTQAPIAEETSLVGNWAPTLTQCQSGAVESFDAKGFWSTEGVEGTWQFAAGKLRLLITSEWDDLGENPTPQRIVHEFSISKIAQDRYTRVDADKNSYEFFRCQDSSEFSSAIDQNIDPIPTDLTNTGPSESIGESTVLRNYNQKLDSIDIKLIEQWSELNGRCRGGSGDDPKTLKACDLRDNLDASKMKPRNLCYGKEGQSGYQYEWHRCVAESLR